MKVFFSLLLIANIAFGLMQWLLPYEQLFSEPPKIAVAEKLMLLSESDPIEVITEAEAISFEQPKTLVIEDASNQSLCYTIGPFKDKTRALAVSGRYSSEQIKTQLKSSLEKDYLGVMVFIDGHNSREDAIKTADSLTSKGIRHYIIVNEEGKSNVLSIGVYSLKKNADQLVDKIRKMDYPVESEPRYRERTIYWLYYRQPNEEKLLSLLHSDDISSGVSQIPRQC